MDMKIPMVAISAFVVVVVLAAVLMPVLTDASTTTDTYTNEGLWDMKALENDDKWTDSAGTWAYEDTTLSNVTSGGFNALLGTDWCIRSSGQFKSTTSQANWNNITVIAVTDVVKIYRDLTMTNLNYTSSDLTGFGAVAEGEYIMTDGTAWYSSGDSTMFGTGQSLVDNVNIFVHVDATVDGGATFTVSSLYGAPEISNVTITNEKVNYTAVSGHDDLYTVSSITCDVSFDTLDDDSNTVNHTGSLTYDHVVVDKQITAERTEHLGSNEIALLAAIPALIIVALVIGVVAIFARSRMD